MAEHKIQGKDNKLVGNEAKLYSDWLHSDLHEELLKNIATLDQLQKYISEFEGNDAEKLGWTLSHNKGTNKTWYRKAEGLTSLDLACECIIKDHLFKPLSLFAEVDLYANWIPRLNLCEIQKSYSRFRKTVQMEVDFPWPFNNRESVCHAYGTVLPEKNAVIVVLRSLDRDIPDHLECPMPGKKNPKNVNMLIHCGCLYFKFIDDSTTLFRGIFNVDAQMGWIPQWLINIGMKQVISKVLEIIQEKCRTFSGSVYEERIKSNSYLYDEIKKRLKMINVIKN